MSRTDPPARSLDARPAASTTRRRLATAVCVAVVPALVLLVWQRRAACDSVSDLAAARDLQSRRQWAASESLATVALSRLEAERGADSLAIAEASYLIGNAHYRAAGYADGVGMWATARSLGIRQRRLGDQHVKTAESHATMGTYLAGIDRTDSALVHVRRALDIRVARLAPDDSLLAESWDQLALLHRDGRRFREAIDAWDHAIEVRTRRDGPEHPEVALLLAQTGICWKELHDPDRARAVLHRSLDMLARTAPDHPRRWIPLNLLADVEGEAGDKALAIDLTQEALRVARGFEATNPRPALTLRGNLAGDLLGFRDFEGALAVYEELVPAMRAQYGASHWRTLMMLMGYATACEGAGDAATAMRVLSAVEDSFAARGRTFERFRSHGQILQAQVLYKLGRHREAAAMSARALRTELAIPSPEDLSVANILYMRVSSLEALGDRAALDSLRPTIKRLTGQYGSRRSGDVFAFAGARAARALGRGEEAWAEALEAERFSYEIARFNLQALPDRRALEFMRTADRYLDLVVDLSRGASDRRETAWDRLVRERGMVRAESGRRRAPREFDSDTLVVAAHARWIAAQRRLAQRLVGSSGTDSSGRRALDRLREAADEAEGGYARILASHGSRVPAAEVGLADVRSRLRPGQALVSFFQIAGDGRAWLPADAGRDTSRVIAFIARAGEDLVDQVDLGRSAVLRTAIAPWRAALAASPGAGARPGEGAERECRRAGLVVRRLTWDRVAPRLGGSTDVFLVGDGPLLDLPWQALPDGASAYLVEAGPRLHTLNAERELMEPRPAAGSASLLAVGAPDYERPPGDGIDALPIGLVRSAPDPCAVTGSAAFAPLPKSGLEAEAVAQAWRRDPGREATVLIGREASERAFKAAVKGRAVVHLATHGVVTRDSCGAGPAGLRGVGGVDPIAAKAGRRRMTPSPSADAAPPAPSPWMGRRVWLALAGANRAREYERDENEGLLTAEEVLTLDLDGTDWVVLSACHSGLAESWSNEGMLGMRRAFALAGARTVIASQWAVEDEATREWMTALYDARATGAANAAQALQSASRAVLASRRAARRSTHPFYWAAFTASGE